MAETRLGVDPSDEPVAGTGVEQPDISVESGEPQEPETPKVFTGDEVNNIVAGRLREANERFERERQNQSQGMEARLFQIEQTVNQALDRLTAASAPDPYAGLSRDERALARPAEFAAKVAMSPIEKKMEQFMAQVASVVAPLAAREQSEQFFQSLPKAVPDAVKQKTLGYLRMHAARGIDMQGAFTLALSDFAREQLMGDGNGNGNGSYAPGTRPAGAPPPAARTQPKAFVDLGGANRSALPNAPGTQSKNIDRTQRAPTLRAFMDEAAQHITEAPVEGAAASARGAGPYRDPLS